MEYLALLKDIFLGGNRYMYIVNGLAFSIGTTMLAALIGVLLGIFIALMELSHFYPLKHKKGWEKFNPISSLAFAYVDLIRGTPAVVQLMILANLIFVGALRDTPILVIAGLSFGINSGAYVAEIIRAGIEGLDKGQMEAARALGMPYGIAMKEIIIPQAVKKILPALVPVLITFGIYKVLKMKKIGITGIILMVIIFSMFAAYFKVLV